jgi:hypothetical protein
MRRYSTEASARELAGADVALVGLFSAKDRGFSEKLDLLAGSVEAHGGRVVSRHVQRRGVSHGGVAKMSVPFSRRTLLTRLSWFMRLRVPMHAGPDVFPRWWVELGESP